jgi:ferrous iron transport protein B
MLFILLCTTCMATIATLQRESRQSSFTALSLGWSPGLAWLVSLVFYQGVRTE